MARQARMRTKKKAINRDHKRNKRTRLPKASLQILLVFGRFEVRGTLSDGAAFKCDGASIWNLFSLRHRAWVPLGDAYMISDPPLVTLQQCPKEPDHIAFIFASSDTNVGSNYPLS
eukprot:scaffold13534_cov69-Cylindrotheca_fusiformis.AAC.5